jgi:glucose/mannose-6-phosphate isomerase
MGWVGAANQSVGRFVGVVLEDGSESERMATRAKVTEGLLKDTVSFHHVRAQGEGLLEKMLMLAHFGDYVSVYLARLNGVDPEDIGSINTLKDELAKVS